MDAQILAKNKKWKGQLSRRQREPDKAFSLWERLNCAAYIVQTLFFSVLRSINVYHSFIKINKLSSPRKKPISGAFLLTKATVALCLVPWGFSSNEINLTLIQGKYFRYHLLYVWETELAISEALKRC